MSQVRTSPGAVIATVLGVAVPLAFLAVFFAWPVAAMIGRGFADGLGGFGEVFSRPRTIRLVGLTLGQAALASVICVVLGLPVAHVLYRLRFRGRALVRALVILPFVLPTVVVGVAFRTLLRDTPLDGTFPAIMMALVFFNIAVVVRTVGTAWEGLDPRQEDAARVLGAGPARVFFTITLPRLGPSIAAAASIVFLFCATAFGVVLVLGGTKFGTIETEIYLLTTQFLDLRGASVLSVAQLAVVVLVLVIAARARSSSQRRIASVQVARRPRATDAPAIADGTALISRSSAAIAAGWPDCASAATGARPASISGRHRQADLRIGEGRPDMPGGPGKRPCHRLPESDTRTRTVRRAASSAGRSPNHSICRNPGWPDRC